MVAVLFQLITVSAVIQRVPTMFAKVVSLCYQHYAAYESGQIYIYINFNTKIMTIQMKSLNNFNNSNKIVKFSNIMAIYIIKLFI